MTLDLKALLRWDSDRREGKPLLRLPNINELRSECHQQAVNEQLTECCNVIAARKLLYRWRRYTGEIRLVIWSKPDGQFLGFDVDLFAHFLGANFDLVDGKGMSFGLPAMSTTSRIIEALAKDERLELVDWSTVSEWRRSGK